MCCLIFTMYVVYIYIYLESSSELDFSSFTVYKEYVAPASKPSLQPDSSYPPWIWDDKVEPTWNELMDADFQSLPNNYKKKIFSIPRKLEIKRQNELRKKS